MKKSLIALAAVAASGAAFAQSSVTLFGTVDANVSVIDGKQTVTGMGNSGTSSSAFGFRGVEDLGNGLKAGFHLEAGINNDSGDGDAGKDATGNAGLEFARRSTLSLMGGFGELRLGRDLTVAYSAVSKYDPFGTVGVGASRVWSNTIGGVRRSNMLSYFSPSFGGFKLNAGYAFGEKVEKDNDGVRTGDYYGLAALYDNGPLSVALSYFDQGRSKTNPDLTKTEAARDGWALGASYDFGAAKLSAAYQSAETSKPAAEGGGSVDLDSYVIGLSAPVGAAGVVKATYNRYESQASGATKVRANHYSLGYVHNLSKRTALYGTYAYLKNKNNGTFSFGPAGLTMPALDNGKIQALQVGVRHSF